MRVVLFRALDAESPAAKQFIARIMLNDGTASPVIFEGSDPEALKAKATAWWAKELARLNPKPRGKGAVVHVNTRAAETKITMSPSGASVTIPAGSTGHHPADPLGDIV